MERVINLLYEIEEKANQIVKRASEEKVRLYESLQKDIEQFDQTIAAENEAKLNALKAQANEDAKLEQQAIIEECNKQLTSMELDYNQNREALVMKVFQSIIGS